MMHGCSRIASKKKRPARRCRFLVRLGAAALHFSDDALIAFGSGGAVR
jgi:hypothetical protein